MLSFPCRFALQRSIILTPHSPEIFDEYTRRQYVAKAPTRNPFGVDDEPAKFDDFDVFTKVRVLQQLSTWTLGNAERIRAAMPQDEDHVSWRMEPLGWDKDDRAYFVLDDNRLYRRTDEPPPPPLTTPKPKSKAKKAAKKSKSRGTRSSKRRKVEESEDEEMEEADAEAGAQDDTMMTNGDATSVEDDEPGYGFTSKTWECIAVTLDDYQEFLSTIFRTRDPNEKQLRKRIEEDVLPIIEKRAEALRAKQLKKMRELENLSKMATAKRSSRLAGKAEKEEQERAAREAEEKKLADIRMAHEEQERQKRIEDGHESRRLTREQRLKEREVKRILHEEELAKIEEQEGRSQSREPGSDNGVVDNDKRMSQRQLKTQREQHRKELEKLAEDDDKWFFDCAVCGDHGENLDDGTHSIACDKCNVWQHSKCHGYTPEQAEREDFIFICSTCKRKEEDASKPKIKPLKLGKNRSSASPESQKKADRPATATEQKPFEPLPDHVQRQLDAIPEPTTRPSPGPYGQLTNAPNLTPHGQPQRPQSGYGYPPVGNFAPQSQPPQHPWQGSPFPPPNRPASSGYAGSPPPQMANGYGSPHYQQHQHVHQHAMSAAGGHPGYQPQYQPPPHAYSPAPTGFAPGQQPPQHGYPQQQYYQNGGGHYGQQHYQAYQQPPPQYYQQHQTPGQPLMNGFQSPTKQPAQPAASSPHQARPPPAFANPMSSPSASFPPPSNGHAQQPAPSPIKSSPAQAPQQWQQRPPPPQLAHTTPQQSFRPPSANGTLATPTTSQQQNPSPAGANANAVAADGMSGPWPEGKGGEVIPRKHDISPAPPGPPQTQPLAPKVALAPSPGSVSQAQAAGPQSVPVKKMVEANGVPSAKSVVEMGSLGVSPGQEMRPQSSSGVGGVQVVATPTPAPVARE